MSPAEAAIKAIFKNAFVDAATSRQGEQAFAVFASRWCGRPIAVGKTREEAWKNACLMFSLRECAA